MPVRNDFGPGEFCWIDLSAHDLEAAVKWYGELFGWTVTMMPSDAGPPYGFLMSGEGVVGGIGQMDDGMKAQGVPPMWNSYVATADCAATEARVLELGGTVTVSTQEVPGHGKLAFFLDPEGASFAAWQSTADEGPGVLVNEAVGLCWNELMTRDVARAKAFYSELFGWDFAAQPMEGIEYTMIRNAEKDGGGMMAMDEPRFDGIPAHWLVYFAVDDCDATSAKAEATGGQVRVPPTEIPVGKFSVLGDPQGGGFCLITLSDPPS